MNKTIAGIGLSIAAIVAVGAIVLINNKDDKKTADSTPTSSETEDHSAMDMNSTEQSAASSTPTTTDNSTTTASQSTSVTIQNFAYSPSKIQVKKGTKVTWTNQDSVKHDVAPDTESANFVGSELLAKGESYSFTFNTVGTYSYYCSPHPYMKATVEVIE
jgi:plastocyanin